MKIILSLVAIVLGTAGFPAVSFSDLPWPPLGKGVFPNLTVTERSGNTDSLKNILSGRKAGLVEFVSITCPACHSFAGAGDGKSPMPGFSAQPGLPSLEQLIQSFAHVSAHNSSLGIILLVLFNKSNDPASASDLREFSDHYGLGSFSNLNVVAARADLTKKTNVDSIPAFYLLDPKDLTILKYSGKNDGGFYTSLLPELGKIVQK